MVLQMSLLRQFDKKYSMRGVFGSEKPNDDEKDSKRKDTKQKLCVVESGTNPVNHLIKDIDYTKSLHTTQL